MSAPRAELVALARGLDGLGMTSNPTAYMEMIGQGEKPSRAREMAQMSGCALLVRALWIKLGVRHPILQMPYVTQRAVSDLYVIARVSDALSTEVRAELPALLPADVVLVGGGPEYGGGWHAWTVLDATATDYPEKGTHLIRGLDGGQKDEHGNQRIEVKTHEITGFPPRDGGRLVRYVIDFEAVWRRWGVG